MAEPLTLADLESRKESRVKLIHKVISGAGTPEEEYLVFHSINPQTILAVATVQAAMISNPKTETTVAPPAKVELRAKLGPDAVGECNTCGRKVYTREMIGEPCIRRSECPGTIVAIKN